MEWPFLARNHPAPINNRIKLINGHFLLRHIRLVIVTTSSLMSQRQTPPSTHLHTSMDKGDRIKMSQTSIYR